MRLITLPWPPSLNMYYRTFRGRMLISAEGREYRVWAASAVRASTTRPRIATGRLEVDIVAYPPDRRIRDLDNMLKALLDVLRYCGYYEDDGQIDDLRIRRGPPRRIGVVHVALTDLRESVDLRGWSRGLDEEAANGAR